MENNYHQWNHFDLTVKTGERDETDNHHENEDDLEIAEGIEAMKGGMRETDLESEDGSRVTKDNEGTHATGAGAGLTPRDGKI